MKTEHAYLLVAVLAGCVMWGGRAEQSVSGKDCKELLTGGITVSGVYNITPSDGLGMIEVYCNMETMGGGWTVIQRRVDGSQDFYRGWEDYKEGFGCLDKEFWLGNEKIHRLTKQGTYKLRIELDDFDGQRKYAVYQTFALGSEAEKYKLSCSSFSGDAGDSLSYHKGAPFSTKDRDNDGNDEWVCAVSYKGAWWYKSCHRSNLNGLYLGGPHESFGDGIEWYTWKGYKYSLKRAVMMIKS